MRNKDNGERCETCRFCDRCGNYIFCVKYAPRVGSRGGDFEVAFDNWCGEWESDGTQKVEPTDAPPPGVRMRYSAPFRRK